METKNSASLAQGYVKPNVIDELCVMEKEARLQKHTAEIDKINKQRLEFKKERNRRIIKSYSHFRFPTIERYMLDRKLDQLSDEETLKVVKRANKYYLKQLAFSGVVSLSGIYASIKIGMNFMPIWNYFGDSTVGLITGFFVPSLAIIGSLIFSSAIFKGYFIKSWLIFKNGGTKNQYGYYP